MSPLLFNIYINVIVKNLKDDDSPRLNNSKVDCLLYADDLVILSTSEEGLQRKLNKLENYCATWRLGLNEEKTMIMQISKCGRLPNRKFRVNDTELINTNIYTYLRSADYVGRPFCFCSVSYFLGTVHLIFSGGGGEGLGILVRAEKFFSYKIVARLSFCRPVGPDYFFHNQKLHL